MTKFSASQQSQLAQIGAFLRDHREKQEKSLEDIAMRTYIRPQLLGGLETGNPDVLPEPIFVQGFIRRYAEVLGFNGVELSQQFTVDSIPSTPRPARSAPPADSPTTRLTRIVPAQPASQAPASPVPVVSTDPSLTLEQPAEVDLVAEANDSEKADIPYAEEPALAPDLLQSAASAPQPPEPISQPIEETTPQPFEPASQPAEPAFMTSEPTFVTVDDVFLTQVPSAPEFSMGGSEAESVAHDRAYDSEPADVQLQARPSDTGDTFDEITAAISSEVSPSVNGSALGTSSFGDDTHSHGTSNETDPANGDRDHLQLDLDPSPTPSDDPAPPPAPSPQVVNVRADDQPPEVFTPQTATPVLTSASPIAAVGVDDSRSRPMLVPLVIGGLAIIAAGAAVLFALFGGDRQPSIADRPDAVEQAAEGTPADPVVETAPVEAVDQLPVSTAPVYVEATATSEAWVSIIADGDPTPIFEGTLLPGESQVWEAQEELSIYAGDPGALQLSANGAEATVMGEPGLPAEKIFP